MLCGVRERRLGRPDLFESCAEGLSFEPHYVLIIDPQTEQLVWQWWLHEHVEELRDVGIVFPRPIDVRSKDRRGDLFHCNTPEVLPDTALGRHDRRFRAGNILLSYRQLDVIYIADRDSGDTEKENKYGPSRPNTNRHTSQQALLQQGPLLRPPASVRNPQLR